MKYNLIISCCQFGFSDALGDVSHEIIISLIGAFIMFVIILFRERICNGWRLEQFNGKYSGFNTETNESHTHNKVYQFKYSFWSNKIKLSQKSENKGDWEAYFLVDSSNPYVSISTFNYLESARYSGNWGTIQIWLNKEQTEIVVESAPKNIEGKGIVTYLLRKQ